jgi:hypothetical protein
MSSHYRIRAKDEVKLIGTKVEIVGPVGFAHAEDESLQEIKDLNRAGLTSGHVLAWNGSTFAMAAPGAGPTGPQGPAGADGADGADGAAGSAGAAGATGPTGPQGPAGADGADGADGAAGSAGAAGATGPTGPQGPAGADGADGADGAAGSAGAAGATGPTGPQGPAGADGAAGAAGADGSDATVQAGAGIEVADGYVSVNSTVLRTTGNFRVEGEKNFESLVCGLSDSSFKEKKTVYAFTTVNATPENVLTIAMSSDSVRYAKVKAVAVEPTALDITVFEASGGAKRVASTSPALLDFSQLAPHQDITGLGGISFSISGNNAILHCTGKAATTLNWKVSVELSEL